MCREPRSGDEHQSVVNTSRPGHTTFPSDDDDLASNEEDDADASDPESVEVQDVSSEVHPPLLSVASVLSSLPAVSPLAAATSSVSLRPYDEPFWPEALLVVRT